MEQAKMPTSKQIKQMDKNIQDCRDTVKWLKEQSVNGK